MADSKQREYSERYLSVDGLALFARDYPAADGDARLPVICLHGLTRNSKDFAILAPHLASLGRRVIVPDMRGRGRSDYDSDPMHYVPQTYAGDVLAWMRALGIEQAVFVGTSMGGIIMMATALRHSRRIAAVILNDVGPEIAAEGLERISSYVGRGSAVTNWDEARAYVQQTSSVAFPDWEESDWDRFARLTFREDGEGQPVFDYDPKIAVPIQAGKAKAPKMLAWILFRRLARRRPALLLRGALSDILSQKIAARMKRAAPAMEVVEVDKVGHAPMLSEADAVAAIDRFLARCP